MAWSFLTATKNARADAVTAQAGTGAKLSLYTAAYSSKLAEWTWTGNVWDPAVNGVLSYIAPAVNPITGLATGDAILARLSKADGTTFIISDMTVGLSGTEVIISNTSIALGQNCNLISFTVTEA